MSKIDIKFKVGQKVYYNAGGPKYDMRPAEGIVSRIFIKNDNIPIYVVNDSEYKDNEICASNEYFLYKHHVSRIDYLRSLIDDMNQEIIELENEVEEILKTYPKLDGTTVIE